MPGTDSNDDNPIATTTRVSSPAVESAANNEHPSESDSTPIAPSTRVP